MNTRFGTRAVVYWCPGDGGHSSLVSVSRSRNPWERVSCPLHLLWMTHDNPIEVERAHDALQRKD